MKVNCKLGNVQDSSKQDLEDSRDQTSIRDCDNEN